MGAYFYIVVKLIWTQMFPPPFPSHLSYQMSLQFFPLIALTIFFPSSAELYKKYEHSETKSF